MQASLAGCVNMHWSSLPSAPDCCQVRKQDALLFLCCPKEQHVHIRECRQMTNVTWWVLGGPLGGSDTSCNPSQSSSLAKLVQTFKRQAYQHAARHCLLAKLSQAHSKQAGLVARCQMLCN